MNLTNQQPCSDSPQQVQESDDIGRDRVWGWALLFVILLIGNRVESTWAQQIKGSVENEHIRVTWEYTVGHRGGDYGAIRLDNLSLVGPDALDVYLKNIIPIGTSHRSHDGAARSIVCDPKNCFGNSCEESVLFRLEPGEYASARFLLSAPPLALGFESTGLEYGLVGLFGSGQCDFRPVGVLNDFVAVKSITQFCAPADIDCDGDVDLHDFAELQNRFKGPQ